MQSDIIIIAVKPQDFEQAIQANVSLFDESKIVISVAAGISISKIKEILPNVNKIVRVMLNTPVLIQKAVVGYALSKNADVISNKIESLFNPLGMVLKVDEGEAFEALTVSCASGTGFVYELMIYWQDWIEEHGFSSTQAIEMTIQTFLGAA